MISGVDIGEKLTESEAGRFALQDGRRRLPIVDLLLVAGAVHRRLESPIVIKQYVINYEYVVG